MRRKASEDFPFFDNDGLPLAFAHRGGALTGSNVGLENSMVAFRAAVGMGYRYLETDVHATADGTVLAFHDTTLDRVTDRSGAVAMLRYDDVRDARIGGREPIPRLAELLAEFPDARVNIDCKSSLAVRPLARLIADYDARERVCVASFSPRRLGELRRLLGPGVATAMGTVGVAGLRFLPVHRLRRLLLDRSAPAVQVPVRQRGIQVVTPGFVDAAHRLGKHVHAWTVDDPAEMEGLLDLGVDGIISDRIDLLREVLVSRSQWR